MIELKDIKVVRKGRLILDLKALSFEDGHKYALIGENGSGKTTLLRLLARIIQPTEGQIIGLEGLKLAYVPQKPYLFRLPVWQNVALAAQESPNKQKFVEEAIKAVGMRGFEKQEAEKLSGGEAQRVALARLLLVKADLVLLDEPTAPIDVRGREKVDAVIANYVRDSGAILIFATHSLEQALKLADQVVKLEDGISQIP